jgi:thiosulfate/3-mercaptopyruvate sulfurtransferase
MGSLTDPDELRGLLPDVTLLDVRWRLGRTDGREAYLAGHIPGAAYVDLATDLADPPGDRGRHPLPEPRRFAAAMRRCGVRGGRPVVVYDDWSGLAATRAWWLLRHHGHPDVRLLDGGWTWWRRTGNDVETGEPAVEPGDFVAGPGRLPVLDAEGAARVARDGVLIDARAPERYAGLEEPVDPVAGHIPGAVNVPATANLDDGRFRRSRLLAEAYQGADGSQEIAAYCGSGVTATHDVFALHLLGREAALYPGSWSEWVTDPRRPVAVSQTSQRESRDCGRD